MSPLVAAAVPFILFFLLGMKLWSNHKRAKSGMPTHKPTYPLYPVTFEPGPDLPVPLGYKTQWFAVRTADTLGVAQALNLSEPAPANWRTGMAGSRAGYYFVAPPIAGWTLVVNPMMPDLSGKEQPHPLHTLKELSSKFGEACYFGTHRIVEYQAWIKSIDGQIVRGYAYLGERGETMLDVGEISPEEREANMFIALPEDEMPWCPNEEHVLAIARLWSVDPESTGSDAETGAGLAGVRSA